MRNSGMEQWNVGYDSSRSILATLMVLRTGVFVNSTCKAVWRSRVWPEIRRIPAFDSQEFVILAAGK